MLHFDGYLLDSEHEQTNAIFKHQGVCNLKKLIVNAWEVSHVEPNVFANFFNKIKEVGLWLTDNDLHTDEQLEELFKTIDDRLKVLDFSNINLSKIDPDILARGFNKLERINISFSFLHPFQFEKIFK